MSIDALPSLLAAMSLIGGNVFGPEMSGMKLETIKYLVLLFQRMLVKVDHVGDGCSTLTVK